MLIGSRLGVVYASAGGADVTALRDFSFILRSGSLAITGPSGSGKSTLLKCLAGVIQPSNGDVSLDDVGVERNDARTSLVFQDNRLVDFLTAFENLQLAAEMRRVDASRPRLIGLLDAVGLAGLEDRYPDTLSGGQQQRVAIARALAAQSRLLLADEPTGALDRANSARIGELLSDLPSTHDVLVVVATHDPEISAMMGSTIELLDGALAEAA